MFRVQNTCFYRGEKGGGRTLYVQSRRHPKRQPDILGVYPQCTAGPYGRKATLVMITEDNGYGALTFGKDGTLSGAVFAQPDRKRPERDWQSVLDSFLTAATAAVPAVGVAGTYTYSETDGGLLITRAPTRPSSGGLDIIDIGQPLPAQTYGLMHVAASTHTEGFLDAVLVVNETAAEEGRPVLIASQIGPDGHLVRAPHKADRLRWRTLGMLLLGLLDTINDRP